MHGIKGAAGPFAGPGKRPAFLAIIPDRVEGHSRYGWALSAAVGQFFGELGLYQPVERLTLRPADGGLVSY